MTIKQKITTIICSATLLIIFIGAVLSYTFGHNILHNVIGRQYTQTSQLLGDYVVKNLLAEIEDAKAYTTLPLWVDVIQDSNLKYKNMGAGEIKSYLEDMDKRWSSAPKGDPIFWGYLENRVSVAMRDIAALRETVSEISMTDKHGGLVASSMKTTNFYYAGEKWWQEAYNNGKGKLYVGDIEFDKSSLRWGIIIASPVIGEKGEVIGICKDNIDIQRLFSVLEVFKSGKTGHAVLVDAKGNIIYRQGLRPMSMKFFNTGEMKKLLSGKENFFVTDKVAVHDGNSFIAYSLVKPPFLSERGIEWVVFIVQDQAETFAPLYKFIGQLVLIAIILIIITIPIGAFFGGVIAKPINQLHIATEKVLSGDWDYKIEVHTGDEIEGFAKVFKNMIADIKDKQTKLEIFSRGLEEKVKERTKELAETQEATLNILEDLEEAKATLEKSNKELKQLDQLKSDFVSTVSHELRTPLSIIKEGVSLVLDRVPGEVNEKQVKILDISKFNIDRLARIIDSLLDISKIEAGKVELKRNLVNISDIVREVASSFELKIKDKGLEFKLDVDKDIGSVYADPDRIAQVLINLINNAIKFTSSGYIEVACKDKDDVITCSIKDTGPGISKSDIPKLFDKFQQFGRLAGAGEKGTGLGLSIAKGIIDMHSGAISVESEPGMGSRFIFTLHKYTEESLFDEYAEKAIKAAAKNRSKVSIALVCVTSKGESSDASWKKGFHNAINDCARLIKNTLRRQGDELVSNEGDMMVVLADCNKEHSILVRQRLEQILDKCLGEKKVRDKLDIKYGCATFPDDGKVGRDLIAKARLGNSAAKSAKA
ncbi:MAG: ATP-binding protein [Candidatus Omnitrophota bacterium]|nr:ATP-binding protein [Candidatus Omnitrophota bacterium]